MKDKVRSTLGKVRKVGGKAVDTTYSTVAKGSKAAPKKTTEVASSVAGSAQDVSRKALDKTIKTAKRAPADSWIASDKTIATIKQALAGSKKAIADTASIVGEQLVIAQGLLASNLSNDLDLFLQNEVKGTATIFDKAMDAEYLATHVGGAYHRLFDGGHTIAGAFRASHHASPDDSILQEAMGTLQGLFRDGTTPMGLPLANWNKETFDQVAGTLESNFHIPKSWFYDLNTYDAADLLGGAIGVVALAFSWNRADTETFGKLVGGMGLSAAFSANPLLLIVTVVALGKAFHKAHQTGEYAELVDGQFRGAIGAGTTIAAISVVGVAGGPAGAALLAGLTAGILVNSATKNVSVVEISQAIVKQVPNALAEVKSLGEKHNPFSPAG